LDPQQNFLFACLEHTNLPGEISSFGIDLTSPTLLTEKPISNIDSRGKWPCHCEVDKTGKFLSVANYGTGGVAIFPISVDGSLGVSKFFLQHKGSSVNKERQEGPHAHQATFGKNNSELFLADLGLDKVFLYKFDQKTGKLSNQKSVEAQPGAGPRHIVELNNSQRWIYVANELFSSISVFVLNSTETDDESMFSGIQTISSIPSDFQGKNSIAEIEITKDGKFLYVSNRGHDSIGMFKINAAYGYLTLIGFQSTKGKKPRHFSIDPTQKFFVIANQESNCLVSFEIDQQNGLLRETGFSISIPSPVCISFKK